MIFGGSPIPVLSAVVRSVIAIALAVALLVLPHLSPTTSASGVSPAMDHMSVGYSDTEEMPGHQGKADGSLCATICAGTNRFLGAQMPRQGFSISSVFWTRTSDPHWLLYVPDRALRPPDTALDA